MPDVVFDRPKLYVYFLQGKVTKLIKIGISHNPRKRIKSLQLSEDVDFLGAIEGDKCLESQLHEDFAPYRKIGEWFEPAPELVAFIRKYSSRRKSDKEWALAIIDFMKKTNTYIPGLVRYYKNGKWNDR